MRRPEAMVESPWPAKFENYFGRRRLISAGAHVGDGCGDNALKHIPGYRSANERLAEYQTNRHLAVFLQLRIGEIVLRFVVSPGLGGNPGISNLAGGRDVAGGIFRPLSLKELKMIGVGEVINLLRLPGPQS